MTEIQPDFIGDRGTKINLTCLTHYFVETLDDLTDLGMRLQKLSIFLLIDDFISSIQ